MARRRLNNCDDFAIFSNKINGDLLTSINNQKADYRQLKIKGFSDTEIAFRMGISNQELRYRKLQWDD